MTIFLAILLVCALSTWPDSVTRITEFGSVTTNRFQQFLYFAASMAVLVAMMISYRS